ncbi:MAG: hypothetical protein ABSD56_01170, partial [Bryobacteraceae bacterium]
GAFLDSTLDRVAEVAIFLGILAGGLAPPMLVLSALSLSFLVSYTRAKGDALGIRLSGVGIGERSERLLILAIASIGIGVEVAHKCENRIARRIQRSGLVERKTLEAFDWDFQPSLVRRPLTANCTGFRIAARGR